MSFNITFSNINATLLLNWFLNDFQGVFFEQFRALVKEEDDETYVRGIPDYILSMQSMHMFVRIERPPRSGKFIMGYVKCEWVFSFARRFEQMRVQLNRIPPTLLAIVEVVENKALRLACVGETDYERAVARYRNDGGLPPSAMALCWNDEDAAEVLLNWDDPNEVSEYGCNVLHTAATQGCRLPLFHRILERIKNVNAVSNDGGTALMYAAANNHLDMVVSLMKAEQIDVNVQNRDNWTALHHAVSGHEKGNYPAILAELLRDERIDCSLKMKMNGDEGEDNWTPLEFAIEYELVECVKILREHGAPEE